MTHIPNITVNFDGWYDPTPTGGTIGQASGIISYTILLHEVIELDHLHLSMKGESVATQHVTANNTISSVEMHLPKQPALYGVSIETQDEAGNVAYARGFVLYDESSTIEIDSNNVLRVSSAFQRTGYRWQIHHGHICLNWKNRYYNSHHKTENLLQPINSETFYKGVYDQLEGQLPLNGTANVDGITQFSYFYTKNELNASSERTTASVVDQSFCELIPVKDGDSLRFNVTSRDIMGSTRTESILVQIDATVPEINNIGINRDQHQELFVHHSDDLSDMTIGFEALDVHSGVHSIEWRLGITHNGNELGQGGISVKELTQVFFNMLFLECR